MSGTTRPGGLGEAVRIIDRFRTQAEAGQDRAVHRSFPMADGQGRWLLSGYAPLAGRPYLAVPPRLVQFWDTDPPHQIQQLLARNAVLAADSGLEHTVFDAASACDFLLEAFDGEVVRLFRACEHPAMQADMFRLLFLLHRGGLYLDADVVLRRPVTVEGLDYPIVFQRTHRPSRNVLNWFLVAPPRHRLFELASMRLLRNLRRSERRHGGRIPATGVLRLTGPALLTSCVAEYLAECGQQAAGLIVLGYQALKSLVMHGPGFLHAKLDYKATEKHWKHVDKVR